MAFRSVLQLGELADVDLTGAVPGDALVLGGGGLWIPGAAGLAAAQDAQVFNTSPFSLPGLSTLIPWTDAGGDTLVDLTVPTSPVIVDDGLYLISCKAVWAVAPPGDNVTRWNFQLYVGSFGDAQATVEVDFWEGIIDHHLNSDTLNFAGRIEAGQTFWFQGQQGTGVNKNIDFLAKIQRFALA